MLIFCNYFGNIYKNIKESLFMDRQIKDRNILDKFKKFRL